MNGLLDLFQLKGRFYDGTLINLISTIHFSQSNLLSLHNYYIFSS